MAADEGPLRTLADANLPVEQAARLFALADGLCRIGRVREGREAGQFSVFNFLLRASYEPDEGEGRRAMVVLMRAGMFRRHTWWGRVRWPHAGAPMRIEAAKPVDRGWSWPLDIDEIRKRLTHERVWLDAVGQPWEERVSEVEGWLADAAVARFDG